jgi:HD-GYP domain-containing protein (c-di-GMP phosphodiesterase class II)
MSRAFDLAVGQPSGHAQRVAYAATALVGELALNEEMARNVFFAALLHDVGLAVQAHPAPHAEGSRGRNQPVGAAVPSARNGAARLSRGRGAPGLLHPSPDQSVEIARRLGFENGVIEALAPADEASDYRDDGALSSAIVAVANHFETLVDPAASPLVLRRTVPAQLSGATRRDAYPEVIGAMAGLACRDEFWLGFYDNDLASHLAVYDEGRRMSPADVARGAAVVAEIVDTRNRRPNGHSSRVAETARNVGLAAELGEGRTLMVALAAKLQDIGTLGIPADILRKPDILTVEEMALMQQHPIIARDLLSEISGLGAVAWWIGCHHERIDGKGYPNMLSGREVPLESQIIGMSEAYQALLSERPYRAPLLPDEAMDIVRGMAGTRFHPRLVNLFESVIV